jgi:UDP-glucose 4-epimerase
MSKILVTGGAGFIGSHTVVELVQAGYTPVIVDNLSNSNASVLEGIERITGIPCAFYHVDCTVESDSRAVFEKAGPFEGVIHFAAFKAVGDSVKHPLKYYHNNLNSTRVLLQLMHEFGTRLLVFSSSCTVYGQPESNPVSEDTPLAEAKSPYGYTKQICERMIHDTAQAGPLGAVLLRYFNPVGAHPSGLIGELPLGVPENLIPYITQTAAGLRSSLTVFGNDYDTPDGTCIRDYIHVVDLAKAHVAALSWLNLNGSGCETFNLGSGAGNSVQEVIDTFTRVTGVALNYSVGPRRAGDVEQIFATASKANTHLQWRCEKSLADALIDAWNWQKKLMQ